jgi:hypothetical protein
LNLALLLQIEEIKSNNVESGESTLVLQLPDLSPGNYFGNAQYQYFSAM